MRLSPRRLSAYIHSDCGVEQLDHDQSDIRYAMPHTEQNAELVRPFSAQSPAIVLKPAPSIDRRRRQSSSELEHAEDVDDVSCLPVYQNCDWELTSTSSSTTVSNYIVLFKPAKKGEKAFGPRVDEELYTKGYWWDIYLRIQVPILNATTEMQGVISLEREDKHAAVNKNPKHNYRPLAGDLQGSFKRCDGQTSEQNWVEATWRVHL